jgi:hypothetical protein
MPGLTATDSRPIGRLAGPAGWVVALVGAWVVPAATHLVGVDWLLPLIVVGVAVGLFHGSRLLLDRVVLVLAQGFGALCVAGLVFSVWPWGLHPVAMGGAALTALVGYAAVTGRRWTPPRRFPAADRLTALAAAGVAVLAAVPFAVRDLGGRVGLLATGEDMGRHLMLTDVIGLVDGYAFLHPARAEPYLADGLEVGLRTYPQGVHFAYAAASRFLRSSGGDTDAVSQAGITIWLYVATFGFLALAVLWAVRRVAGPAFADPAGALRLLPVLAVAGAWLTFSDPIAVFARGYPNQLAAMALVAVLTAVVVRPLPRFGDQVGLLVLLLVGVSFTYHLYLPYAGLAAAIWTVRAGLWTPGRRRALLTVVVAALLAAPVLLITPLLTLQGAGAAILGSAGTALPIDRPATALLAGLVVAGLVAAGGLRAPARRTGLATLVATVAVTAVLGLYQLITVGRTAYYFEKLAHAGIVVGLVLLGTLARVVPRWYRPRADRAGRPTADGAGRWRPAATALAPALALCLVLAAAGGPWHTRPGSLGARLVAGVEGGSPDGGQDAVALARRWPDGGGKVTIDVAATPYRTWFGTYFGSVLQRRYRHGHAWYGLLNPANPPRTLDAVEALVVASPQPLRLVVSDPHGRALLEDPAHEWTNAQVAGYLAERYPGKVEVVRAAP